MHGEEVLITMFAIFAIFIAMPWIILNFLARRREASTKEAGDPALNATLNGVAGKLEKRLDAMETLLEHEVPGWRRPAQE